MVFDPMWSFALRQHTSPELDRLRALVALQGAVIRILLRCLPQVLRILTDADRRQLAELAQPLGWRVAADALQGLAASSTLRGWFNRLVKARPRCVAPVRRASGRQPIPTTTRNLIVRLARENLWGYRRIVGVLRGLNISVSRSSVKRILDAHGIKPAPERARNRANWKAFLAAHWSTLASIDFTTVPVLTLSGWKPCMIAVVMHVATRRVHVATVTMHPDAVVMQQLARNLTMADTGFLAQHGITHLIHDGGGEFCKTGFDAVLVNGGIEIVRIPPRAPNCNPHIERFFGSLKSECLRQVHFVGDRGLYHTCQIYAEWYNHRRPHQGIGNVCIDPDERLANTGATIKRSVALGGILSFYHRAAA